MGSDSSDRVRNGAELGHNRGKNGALLKSTMGNFKSIIDSSLLNIIDRALPIKQLYSNTLLQRSRVCQTEVSS